MLVMFTLKASVSSQLPPTAYIKFIDIWFLCGISMPFVIIIIIIMVEHLQAQDQVLLTELNRCLKIYLQRVTLTEDLQVTPSEAKGSLNHRLQLLGKFLLPISHILFIVVYSAIASIFYQSH